MNGSFLAVDNETAWIQINVALLSLLLGLCSGRQSTMNEEREEGGPPTSETTQSEDHDHRRTAKR